MISRGMNGGFVVLVVLLLSGVLASASDDSSLSTLPVLRGSRRILGTPDLSAAAEEITDIEQAKEIEVQEYSRRMLGMTQAFGGTGGTPFDERIHLRIWFMEVRCGDSLDYIKVTYTDGQTFTHGGGGGTNVVTLGTGLYMFDPNQPVTIDVYTGSRRDSNGNYLDNIVRGMFFYQDRYVNNVLQKDTMVLQCGTYSGQLRSRAITNYILKGFHGSAGRYIDRLGFYF